jgi:transcriptional regulator with XRE-family HTH domain
MRAMLKYHIIRKFGTQSEFARSFGKNDNWISRIVCGRQDPSPEELVKIQEKLGIPNLNNFLQNNVGGEPDVHTGDHD